MAQFWILCVSLIVQLTAAGLAIRLIFVTGKRLGWVALALAILLMSGRRALTLYDLAITDDPFSSAATTPELLALAISVLVLVAVLSIRPVFDAARGFDRIERRLGRILDSSLHEIFIFDARDLHFIRVNHGARDNLGYTMDELSRMTPVDLKPEFTEDSFRELFAPLERREVDRLRFSARHRRKDGTEYPVDVDLQLSLEGGEPSFIAVIHDMTDKVRAEEKLAASEAHFRSLIENAQDVITVLDEHGAIRYHSPSVERLLGYRPEDRVGRKAMDSIHPDDVELTKKTLHSVLTVPGPHSVTYRLRHVDGTWRTVEAIGRSRQGPDGSREVIINQRDVTDRAQVEAQLRQAQKLETIGTLAGGIAHDFNNFLTPILGYAELIKQSSGADAPAGLDEIRLAGERARHLVRQILTFSRRTETRRCPLDLAAVLDEAITLARSTLPANVDITTRVEPDLGFVLADRTQLHQVVLSICTNAYQAMMPGGGTIGIDGGREDVGPDGRHGRTNLAPGPYLTMTFRDTGCGMAPEVAERVFEPFFTTKNAAEGTGLGLAVAHGIIVDNGGDVHVESVPGEGTVFRIRLPRIAGTRDARAEETLELGGTERILLVDDDEAVTRFLSTLLRSLGYEVTSANHPADALEFLSSSIDRVDLIITDLTMPGMSGLQLARRAKALREDLPIILISGHSGEAAAQDDVARIVGATLCKPFRARDIDRAIRALCGARPGATSTVPRDRGR